MGDGSPGRKRLVAAPVWQPLVPGLDNAAAEEGGAGFS